MPNVQHFNDWYKKPDTNEFIGFLLDVKTEIRKPVINGTRKTISGIVLYFLTDTYQKYSVYLINDPYFYVIFDTTKYLPEVFKNKVIGFVNDTNDRIKNAKSKVKLKDLQFIWLHDANHPQHRFMIDDTQLVLKLIFETPTDVSNLRDKIKKLDGVLDVREDNILFDTRTMIDHGLYVGRWYKVSVNADRELVTTITELDINKFPEFLIIGIDIETNTKPPHKPDPQRDSIYLISICCGESGYLIQNMDILKDKIKPITYKAGSHLTSQFRVIYSNNENDLIADFLWVLLNFKKSNRNADIIATYNGDKFDFWFLNERAKRYGINLRDYGILVEDVIDRQTKIYGIPHIDTYIWAQRFSYSAKGELGAKDITKKFLNYEPEEVKYEDLSLMTMKDSPIYNPQKVGLYSASDSLIPYLLASKIVNNFLFAISRIIPITAYDALREGAGSMAELVMLRFWHQRGIIAPNKYKETEPTWYNGYLTKSVSYTGGYVELGKHGVFRSDLDASIPIDRNHIASLLEMVSPIVESVCTKIEAKKGKRVVNKLDVVDDIKRALTNLMNVPGGVYQGRGQIWKVDVKAMYPNIILTFKLQPYAIVSPNECQNCKFNTGDCWLDEEFTKIYTIILADEEIVNRAKESLKLSRGKSLAEITLEYLKAAKKNGKRVPKLTEEITKREKVRFCQKAHDFFVQCVDYFKQLRYDYKQLTSAVNDKIKELKKAKDTLPPESFAQQLKDLESAKDYYYNMQLAFKVILNSFYGYLSKSGSRLYSIGTAGTICSIGEQIITFTKDGISGFTSILEIDTDGCNILVPDAFPTELKNGIKLEDGSTLDFNFLIEYINWISKDKFTNQNYYSNPTNKIAKCEIEFDLDGPFHAFISFAKKKYIIFKTTFNPLTNEKRYEIAEEKGIEKKRGGELGIIKEMYSKIIFGYLKGNTLEEAYQSAYQSIKPYIDMFVRKSVPLHLLSESRELSKQLDEYSGKGKYINAGKKMLELGIDVETSDKIGWIVLKSDTPAQSLSDRSIPDALFKMDSKTISSCLKKWLGVDWKGSIEQHIDFEHYFKRVVTFLGKVVGNCAKAQGIQLDLPDSSLITTKSLKSYLNKEPSLEHDTEDKSSDSTPPSPKKQKRKIDLLSFFK